MEGFVGGGRKGLDMARVVTTGLADKKRGKIYLHHNIDQHSIKTGIEEGDEPEVWILKLLAANVERPLLLTRTSLGIRSPGGGASRGG